MKTVSLRILLVLSLLIGLGTASPVWTASADTPPADIKIEKWQGQVFTFLALPADKQSDGYEIFTVDQADKGFQGDRSVRIPYAEHAGKQVTVTAVVPFPAGYNQQEYTISMTVNDTGEKLLGRTIRGQLEGLVLASDLENARKQFLGKTIYPKFRELSGLYVPDGNTVPKSVATDIGAPVTVVDVYLGNQSQEPVWLIVSVNGEKAVLPIAYSWTNMPVQAWTESPPWQGALFTEDPRKSLGGSYELWGKIQNGSVEAGMTKGQVELSWGKPFRTEANDSVWIYNTEKLSFDGDVLHLVETLAASK
ncbi:hypothetical protein [Sporomusa termitida]|uniref:DUF4367 domain-containing protein n=1 Tax=Sporomusa termitida TaxID=2377 RepID=A0A517DP81_9FIRM|nr:hypothetical protein [Sporomusa termitida]QDR79169.1 hypothetical protein SPTER_04370 [Sporomusa termitida]